MNLCAWEGALLGALNNSMSVTNEASVSDHAHVRLIDPQNHYSYRNKI